MDFNIIYASNGINKFRVFSLYIRTVVVVPVPAGYYKLSKIMDGPARGGAGV